MWVTGVQTCALPILWTHICANFEPICVRKAYVHLYRFFCRNIWVYIWTPMTPCSSVPAIGDGTQIIPARLTQWPAAFQKPTLSKLKSGIYLDSDVGSGEQRPRSADFLAKTETWFMKKEISWAKDNIHNFLLDADHELQRMKEICSVNHDCKCNYKTIPRSHNKKQAWTNCDQPRSYKFWSTIQERNWAVVDVPGVARWHRWIWEGHTLMNPKCELWALILRWKQNSKVNQ